ncbi:MAG: DUF4349 domain-containing protein [Candidatus Limnocylindrales bacterium]|jgi:hypothetical protein
MPLSRLIAALAVVALLGAAYVVGSPNSGTPGPSPARAALAPGDASLKGALPAASPATGAGGFESSGTSSDTVGTNQTSTVVPNTATLETTQIVKTGSMSLEVSDIDKAVAQAKSAIVGMGGDVSQSSQSGDKESATASVTYRVPAAKFDAAIAAMRGLAGRVVSEQTNSTDVTSQVVDYDARLANLQVTEAALQSIMARATTTADVLAVEQQLSTTQGQIEELTAQRDELKNQAAMSTLNVTFSLPTVTVTTQATQDWDLGAQVDQAAAALIRVGQGLVTIGVWAVIVGLPIVLGLALLLGILWVLRRVARRRHSAVAGA